MTKAKLIFFFAFFSVLPLFSQKAKNALPNSPAGNILCDNNWNYTIAGTCIGYHSMKTLDLDNDGKLEIAMASYAGDYYVHTMQYDSANNTYVNTWVSDRYTSQITYVGYFDTNNDNIYEIFVCLWNGKIVVYDGGTKKIIGQFTTSNNYDVNAIDYGDIDNDGTAELVISDMNSFHIHNATTYSVIQNINTYGANDFKVGNVDNDPKAEIVTSNGDVLEYNGTNFTTQWHFVTPSNGWVYIELSDIDADGKKEILDLEAGGYLRVYDADTQTLRFQKFSNIGLCAVTAKDINSDGIEEIFYGDNQWGNVYCINSVNGAQLWSFPNTNYDITRLNVADIDHDGIFEIYYGSGCGSSGGDTLYVFSTATRALEWKSKDGNGLFRVVGLDDIDNDGTKEIVSVSFDGSMVVFDAVTHKLEWQCGANYFGNVWTGIDDFSIYDIDNDGVKDIIVVSGSAYTGELWVLDGITKVKKISHLYPSTVSSFSGVEIADLDNNGTPEIIAINDKVNIINRTNYNIIWSSSSLASGSSYKLKVGNIDTDPALEILVTVNNNLYVFDGVTHQMWQGSSSNYRTIELYDMTGDNIKDIIVGRTDGKIDILDATNNYQVVSSTQYASQSIDGIAFAMLDADTIPELLFASAGVVYLKTTTGISQTPYLGNTAGDYNALKVGDANGDGINEIFIGSRESVYEIDYSCYHCAWFGQSHSSMNVSCIANADGQATVTPGGGSSPYSYSWSNGAITSTVTNLNTGVYTYTVSDNTGCWIADSINIIKAPPLMATVVPTNVSCQGVGGSAQVNISQGTAPFSYTWSNGATSDSIGNLSTGTYSVVVTDTLQCRDTLTTFVSKDSILLSVYKQDVMCFGAGGAYIQTYVTQGQSPFTFLWNNGQTGGTLSNLFAGTYYLSVSDARGCNLQDTFLIVQPAPLTATLTSTADDPGSTVGDGTASILVSGGTAPYLITWSDAFSQIGATASALTSGTYSVTVRDGHYCMETYTVSVGVSSNDIKVFPNPAQEYIEVKLDNAQSATLRIYDEAGRKMEEIKEFYHEAKINVHDFAAGNYTVQVLQSNSVRAFKFVIRKQP